MSLRGAKRRGNLLIPNTGLHKINKPNLNTASEQGVSIPKAIDSFLLLYKEEGK
jgi:hypothetical protein